MFILMGMRMGRNCRLCFRALFIILATIERATMKNKKIGKKKKEEVPLKIDAKFNEVLKVAIKNSTKQNKTKK